MRSLKLFLWYNPAMRVWISIWAVSALTALLLPLTQQVEFTALFQFLSELPVLAATIWLFLKLASLHLTTIDKLIVTFGEREQLQRTHHKMITDSLLAILEKK